MRTRVRTIVSFLACIAMFVELGAAAVDHIVGGATSGWDTSSNIPAWASAQSFKVGDSLVFNYGGMHNVMEVSKSDYDICQATNPITSWSDGNTKILLPSPGKRYFICATMGHCSMGMKLAVNPSPATTAAAPPPKPVAGVPPTAKSPSPKGSAPTADSPLPESSAPTADSPLPEGSAPTASSPATSPEDDAPTSSPIAPSTMSPSPTPSAAPARYGFPLFGAFVAVGMMFAF